MTRLCLPSVLKAAVLLYCVGTICSCGPPRQRILDQGAHYRLHREETDRVRIDSDPRGAKVFVNDELVGQTPIDVNLRYRSYTYRLFWEYEQGTRRWDEVEKVVRGPVSFAWPYRIVVSKDGYVREARTIWVPIGEEPIRSNYDLAISSPHQFSLHQLDREKIYPPRTMKTPDKRLFTIYLRKKPTTKVRIKVEAEAEE